MSPPFQRSRCDTSQVSMKWLADCTHKFPQRPRRGEGGDGSFVGLVVVVFIANSTLSMSLETLLLLTRLLGSPATILYCWIGGVWNIDCHPGLEQHDERYLDWEEGGGDGRRMCHYDSAWLPI